MSTREWSHLIRIRISVCFFGFKISAASLSSDDKKVEAILGALTPWNAGEVRSFLGLVIITVPDVFQISPPCMSHFENQPDRRSHGVGPQSIKKYLKN